MDCNFRNDNLEMNAWCSENCLLYLAKLKTNLEERKSLTEIQYLLKNARRRALDPLQEIYSTTAAQKVYSLLLWALNGTLFAFLYF